MAQKPLELILARNFLTSLSTPAFLVDESGALIFYNEAAGAMLGSSFEEQGRMRGRGVEAWRSGPFARDGKPIPIEELPTTKAAAPTAAPPTASSRIRSAAGRASRSSPAPSRSSPEGGSSGAMIFFWPDTRTRGV